MEGFFADPIYGGNRDMAALEDDRLSRACPRPIDEEIEHYLGKNYDKPPQSIADFS